MRGDVLSFDPATGAGWISGEDGARYSFTTADLAAPVPVHPGARLDFVPLGTTATRVMAAPGQAGQVIVGTTASSGGLFSLVTPDPVGEPGLSMWGYVKRCFRKYADFNGRARRKEYWSFALLYMVALLPFYCLQVGLMIGAAATSPAGSSDLSPAGATMMLAGVLCGLVTLVIALGFLVPVYAVLARRFHDVGLSAWWMLIAFVPVLSLALVVVLFMPSQPGANIYGRYPKPVT